MKDFHQLKVWEKSHALTLAVYQATKTFPKDEMFGLTNQIRRASVSIPANIAEGCGRTIPDFGRFLQMAFGSASEVEYHLLLSKDLGYLPVEVFQRLSNQIIEIKQMLATLINKIKTEN